MSTQLRIRNESTRKRLYRRDTLTALIDSILTGESINCDTEISLLFCDDLFIKELNRQYRKKNQPTDVLSFEQPEIDPQTPRVLGDIVISLETVEQNCQSEKSVMQKEIRMLVCHGVLHLLGYDHKTKPEKSVMNEKQAAYLGLSSIEAWDFGPKSESPIRSTTKSKVKAHSGAR